MSVKLIKINKFFGENHVLKDIDLEIYDKQTTVILGSSGSGKSTLLRCINLLETPDSGQMYLRGFYLNFSLPIKERQKLPFRSHTGMVFQDFNLFPHLNVLENIIEAPINVLKIPKDEAVETARNLLKKVGLSQKENAYIATLSGGQKQRVAIVRALAMKPYFLLLDEPTSALDPELEAEVLKVIFDLSKEQRSIIIVTHNMEFARRAADRILFLDKGNIIFDGTSDEFFYNDNDRIVNFISAMKF
ncbi:amino acid ABC transporter ATP-binding protein [Campylobacter gastrosuis]|uniref:Amino acid ABC transporter ATP-binding protein n=1 Tax=Campylobacter gastrosuis TaxID=2974576 RepID=A0ABT7HT98_9BACT|nr:amino acid ABC transporter ATP-binding protein [Campylobacter gastrosuis]MDL0089633.1 amino acid ABC transporter ATP-binding protein [Campylobacter gastrosuis]